MTWRIFVSYVPSLLFCVNVFEIRFTNHSMKMAHLIEMFCTKQTKILCFFLQFPNRHVLSNVSQPSCYISNPLSKAQDIDWQIIDGSRFQFSIGFDFHFSFQLRSRGGTKWSKITINVDRWSTFGCDRSLVIDESCLLNSDRWSVIDVLRKLVRSKHCLKTLHLA